MTGGEDDGDHDLGGDAWFVAELRRAAQRYDAERQRPHAARR